MRCRLVFAACAAGLLFSSFASANRPLETAVWHPGSELGLQRVHGAGAKVVYMFLEWSAVAPSDRPVEFDPRNPNDPAYAWSSADDRLVAAVRQGLTPIVSLYRAPRWAQGAGPGSQGTVRPDPTELANFARAAALRYSGRHAGLPRVRYWQVWAEQNLFYHLNPQRDTDRTVSPHWYRRMLNAAAEAIHSVPGNIVITGGLAPFTPKLREQGVGPLEFMREMLCLSKRMTRTCKERSHFDIWAHHPYTSGGPTHQAYRPDDVSLGDLPEMRRVLNAAYRNSSIVSKTSPRFWVTEFSWDTKPPDPRGVPVSLHARWVAEALYRMWRSGVSLVTWLQLRDAPLQTSFNQAGLYFRGPTIEQDRPKPALRAFRFPFVSFPTRRGIYVWGRTPAGAPGRVAVEQSFRGGWRRVGVLRTNRHGIFERRFAAARVGFVRARNLDTRELARPFSLKHHPDQFFNPFGLTTLLEPRRKGRP